MAESTPGAESDGMDHSLLIQLAQETRLDVKRLLESMAAIEQRVVHLERRAPVARPRLSRDIGMSAGAGAVVVAVLQGLQAMGWLRVPPAPTPAPAAIVAPAPIGQKAEVPK